MARTFGLRDINLLFWQASKVRGITDGEGQGYRGGEIADPDLDIFVPSASRMDDGTILGSDGIKFRDQVHWETFIISR